MKLLLLLQNYEKYLSGYYHQDWVNALKKDTLVTSGVKVTRIMIRKWK